MNIGIVGYGHVGKAMHQLFQNAVIFDEPLKIGEKSQIQRCDIAFVCVPTPQTYGGNCDTSIVEEVIDWLEVGTIVIRSTVPVGFTDSQIKKTGKEIVFQPEYYGETVDHPFVQLKERKWLTLGGTTSSINNVIRAYQDIHNSEVKIVLTDPKTAEMAKYMENCYLALKVTFCNEFFDLAEAYDVDYNELREVWLEDPRIGRSHTFVYSDKRGFSGKCLPKDLNATISMASDKNVNVNLLKTVSEKNNLFLKGGHLIG